MRTITPPDLPHADEAQRLSALHDLGVLNTPPEALLDSLTRAAAAACAAPVALLTLVDASREWVKSQAGAQDIGDIRRAEGPGAWVLDARGCVEIADARRDTRAARMPWVAGSPGIVF